ncbi:MAG: exodeoxyribonuclease VII small subunit [Pseudomonadota bacterium]
MSETPIAEMRFEAALAELERVVTALEDGKVPLEDSISLYERGNALRARCEWLLQDAEMKVQRIVQGADGPPSMEAAAPAPVATKAPTPADKADPGDDIPF